MLSKQVSLGQPHHRLLFKIQVLRRLPPAAALALCFAGAPSISCAAPTASDYVTCTLVYGALFQVAKDTQHEPTLKYVAPRLKAVFLWIKANENTPQAKQLLREKAIALEQEVKIDFTSRVKAAITTGDGALLRSSFGRVFTCDQALGIASDPLPVKTAAHAWSRYAGGFYSGCLDKQHRTSPQIPMRQVETYCRCMTNAIATKGITAESPDETISATIKSANRGCVAAAEPASPSPR